MSIVCSDIRTAYQRPNNLIEVETAGQCPAGAVEPRTTSCGCATMSLPKSPLPPSRRSEIRSTAAPPRNAVSCPTLVRSMCAKPANALLSNPITETSPGTEIPARRKTSRTPSAQRSLKAKTAPGNPPSTIDLAAAAPNSSVRPPGRILGSRPAARMALR